MLIKVEGCIWPKCEGGLNCPLSNPPDRCEADLSELDRLNWEDEIKVREGKEAAKRIAKRKAKERERQWYLDNKEKRREYMREYYYIRKERKKNDSTGSTKGAGCDCNCGLVDG